MSDEPAPVGGLVASSGRVPSDANEQPDAAAVPGAHGAWTPRALAFQESQRRELLAARYACEVGRQQHIAGLQCGHCLLESWAVTEGRAGYSFVCEISNH